MYEGRRLLKKWSRGLPFLAVSHRKLSLEVCWVMVKVKRGGGFFGAFASWMISIEYCVQVILGFFAFSCQACLVCAWLEGFYIWWIL